MGYQKSISEIRGPTHRRWRMIQRYGHRCFECQLAEWRGRPIPLQVDHIDGNSDHNDESNLRLLCNNCHGLTETFGGRNKGRHPKTKRIQYMDGYRKRSQA